MGCERKNPEISYQGNVRPHLEYGSSSWMTAAKSHHQNLNKVQNQALHIIAGAMKSTPINSMEETTNILPLSRLKRSSFTLVTRALQRKQQEVLPKYGKTIAFTMNNNPCEEKLGNVIIQASVSLITTKDEQTSTVKKTLTIGMLEDEYPSDSWIRVYTGGSVTNATTKGAAGIYIKYPNGDQHSEAKSTGLHCSNYKAEEEALIHAAHSIKTKVDNTTQVVFLTDALSVLQSLTNDKLPQLEKALYAIKSLTTELQWIPSHCGVWGNEQPDKLAKHGAEQQQEDNPVCYTEMKTIIKSLFNTPQQQDSYHQLTRSEQTTVFRLRTGHNRLNQHLYKVVKVVPSPMCPCGGYCTPLTVMQFPSGTER
ncbi:unnamed protein product [Mytilus coruscus]|uniref:RNase H type-1 domain-containing protein n=1 Tax=Mytilus coruscus TaxID=42192 RepID=A0A6J8ALI4_MYTCO|nr:unnamed protein product [Mytilus coruscus]